MDIRKGRCAMQPKTSSTLTKWGNSQGVRIPKEICDLLGAKVGTEVDLTVDQAKSQLTLTFEQPGRKYHRNRKVSIQDLCADWKGDKVGEEWGGSDVGSEVVE